MSTLAEELLILSLPDYTGRSPGTALGLDQALSGAVIIELMTLGRIKPDGSGRLMVVNREPTNNGVLNNALRKIAEAKPGLNSREWISRLAWEKPRLRSCLLQQMRDHGTVQQKRRRFLGMIPISRYYMLDPTPATRLRHEIRRALLMDRYCDPRMVILISLLIAARLLGAQLPPEERQLARERAKELIRHDTIVKAVADLGGAEAAVSAIIYDTKNFNEPW